MKIKQLKEKTAQGLKDFLPKIGVNDIEGLLDAINDKLSKSEGGEVNKHIVITNDNGKHSLTINPDGSIYIYKKSSHKNVFSIIPSNFRINISGSDDGVIGIYSIDTLTNYNNKQIYEQGYDVFTASKFKLRTGTNNQVLLGDGSTTSNLVEKVYLDNVSDTSLSIFVKYFNNIFEEIPLEGATKELAGLMTAADKAKLDDIPNIYAEKSKTIRNIDVNNLNNKRGLYILVDYADRTNPGTTVNIPNATSTTDGCMSYEDKNKLDNIENTYLPLSGGTMSGVLYLNDITSNENGLNINNVNRIVSIEQDKVLTPEVWTTDGNSIPLNKPNGIPILNSDGKLVEYISSQNGNIYSSYNVDNGNTILNVTGSYEEEDSGGKIILKRTEDNKGKASVVLDGAEGSVNAENFKAINNQNKNEVWCTDGTRLNVLDLLSNAAIYVAGGKELADSGINDTTVIDNPDSIIFDLGTRRFLARKSLICYTHWKADISKNIAPPSRYGIETDNGVFPFNNQLYRFNTDNNLYTAICSNGTCTIIKLALN